MSRRAATLAALVLLLSQAEAPARDHGEPRSPDTITAIVIHAVRGPICVGGAVRYEPAARRPDDATFWRDAMRKAPVEAHYVIGRDGTTLGVIPVDQIAYHTKGINDVSIGIELVNDGDGKEPFPPAQIASLETLTRELRRRFPAIRFANIARHSDIDQRTCPCGGTTYSRRQDPGDAFPMAEVLAAVRLPTDAPMPTALPRLSGAAPAEACVTR